MTNFEKIKAMSIDEMSAEISYLGCDDCPLDGHCYAKYPDMLCTEKIKKWLQNEVNENGGRDN